MRDFSRARPRRVNNHKIALTSEFGKYVLEGVNSVPTDLLQVGRKARVDKNVKKKKKWSSNCVVFNHAVRTAVHYTHKDSEVRTLVTTSVLQLQCVTYFYDKTVHRVYVYRTEC